jgi:MtN3 and saliva related transmembrane protein
VRRRRRRAGHPEALKMAISLVSLIGSAAGVCTTVAYMPQVIRTWRTRSTTDISLGMFSVMVLGVILWLVYGIALNDWPIIGANTVTLVLTGTILFLKLRHG